MKLVAILLVLVASTTVAAPAFDVPHRWIHGAAGEPVLQVHEAAPGTWLMRQGKASNVEAPFIVLLAGSERALLIDTGAEPVDGRELPLRKTVDDLLERWAKAHERADMPLVVAHTHGHGDHHFGDAQFRDRPSTQIVGIKAEDVAAFFELSAWPDGEAKVDLGDRTVTVLPLPGHEPAHVAVYDAATQTVFSGDTLYPGLLTVRDWRAFRASAARLDAFADTHPVARAIGAHIEMTSTPGRMYPLGTAVQPEEHDLALERRHVHELATAAAHIGDFIADDGHDDFIIGRVPSPSTDRASTHGMLVVGSDVVYVSHLPMMHAPHDYQLIFEAELAPKDLEAYRVDVAKHADEVYTVAPTKQWVLPETIRTGAEFEVDLYRGHFERGGTVLLRGVRVRVKHLVHFRHFEPGRKPDPAQWIGFGRGTEHFVAHRIEGAPDLDQIVQVDVQSGEGESLKLPATRALKAGDRAGATRAQRIIYTETGDLAE